MHFAQAAEHGFQPSRFGHGNAADVEVMHGPGDALQLRISVQAEARGHHLEGHACADVGEAGAVVVEADGAARRLPGIAQPGELGLGVDEAPDSQAQASRSTQGLARVAQALPLNLAGSSRSMPSSARGCGSPLEN